MKEILSVITFGIGALCFVVFLTVVKPDAASAVPRPGKLGALIDKLSHAATPVEKGL
jgi:hypothetical protein